jgi:hypothetical protein
MSKGIFLCLALLLAASAASAEEFEIQLPKPFGNWKAEAPAGFERGSCFQDPNDRFNWRMRGASACAQIFVGQYHAKGTPANWLGCPATYGRRMGMPVESSPYGYHAYRYGCQDGYGAVWFYNVTLLSWTGTFQYIEARMGFYTADGKHSVLFKDVPEAFRKASGAAFEQIQNSIGPKDAKDAAAAAPKPAKETKAEEDGTPLVPLPE